MLRVESKYAGYFRIVVVIMHIWEVQEYRSVGIYEFLSMYKTAKSARENLLTNAFRMDVFTERNC